MKVMWRLLLALMLMGTGEMLLHTPVHAQTCESRNDGNAPTYAHGTRNPTTCNTHGAQHMTIVDENGSSIGSSMDESLASILARYGTATAAAPTLAEGAAGYFSWDLAGNARFTLGTLLFGEDQTNNLFRVSGGAIRTTTVMTGVTTNTTSATTTVFSGAKKPMASVTGTGAITATVQFYGDMENTTTHGDPLCPAIVLSGTTKAVGFCPQITADYPYYHAVTTAVSGTGATVEATIVTGISANNAKLEWTSSGIKTADALIKTGYGWLQCITIAQNDAAPTAGTISVNDAVSAGTGTALFTWVLTTAVFTPFQVCPQVPFTTGLYIDVTTVADVNISLSYR